MEVPENGGIGKCRYWKMQVPENVGTGKCRYWKMQVPENVDSVININNIEFKIKMTIPVTHK